MKAKAIKQKRTYNKVSVKRKIFNIKTDMKHLSKIFFKLQGDVDALREIAKKKYSLNSKPLACVRH